MVRSSRWTGSFVRRLAGAGIAAAVLVPLIPVTADAAVEVIPAPRDGSFTVIGHGYGHGRGMSQWGARGAAAQGLTWPAILDFYYPGTARTGQPDEAIRVWLKEDTDNETRVLAEPGITAQAAGSGAVLLPTVSANGGAIVLWRVYRDATGLRLQGMDGPTGVWIPQDITGLGYATTTITFTTASGLVKLGNPATNTFDQYRGAIRAIPSGAAPGLKSLAVLPMEQYLRSVVPNEMPSSWPAEGLKAQAVAARTYASRARAVYAANDYDTCDDTACQMFVGTATFAGDGVTVKSTHEAASTDAAIAATSNVVLVYNGQRAFTEFSASNGGYTVAGSQPYLVAQPDPYDGAVPNASNSWSATIRSSAIAAAYPSVGTFRRLRVLGRDGNGAWGGRITSVAIDGSAGSVTVTASAFRAAVGLKSIWWTVTDSTRRVGDVSGDGRTDVLALAGNGELLNYRGNGSAGWLAPTSLGLGWADVDLVTPVGDFTGDGFGDVVARDKAGALFLYLSNGTGGWAGRRQIGTGWQGMDALVGVGDFTGDGYADVLARETATGVLWVYPGAAGGVFAGPRISLGGGWGAMDELVAVGDFDGDGAVDVAAREKGTGLLWLYRGDGAGGIAGRVSLGGGWDGMTAVVGRGDFNGDGAMDLLARDAAGLLWLYPGNGAGGFGARSQVGSGWQIFTEMP